jgi:Uma2 family endonuclease
MVATSPVPPGELVATADQRVVMHGVPWAHYEVMLALRGDKAVPRMSYLDGAMELMSPSLDHEMIKSLIGCLVEVYALQRGIDFMPYGSWTLKEPPKKSGVEADECYIFGSDQRRDRPDLAIEVVWTSGGIDKLEAYRRLRVREVWYWKAGGIEVYVLGDDAYQRSARSAVLPELDLELLCSFLDRPTASQAIREFGAALQRR